MRPRFIAMLIAGLLTGNANAQPQTLQGPNAPGSVPGLGTLPAMPGQNAGWPPVGSTTAPGTTAQVFPHPPIVPPATGTAGMGGSPAPAYGSTYSPPAYGSGSPVTATAPALPGYATPGTTPLPGYTAPPGAAGFPPVTGVPSPGMPLVPDTGLMTGAGGTGGFGASGTGSEIERAIGPRY